MDVVGKSAFIVTLRVGGTIVCAFGAFPLDFVAEEYQSVRKKARQTRFIKNAIIKENSEISYHVDKSMKFSYYVCGVDKMTRKTVAIDDGLIRDLDIFARKEHRDFSSALRYALRIGLLAIENPDLTVQEIKDIIEARIDFEMGNVSELDTEEL